MQLSALVLVLLIHHCMALFGLVRPVLRSRSISIASGGHRGRPSSGISAFSSHRSSDSHPTNVCIIGGGLSGLSTAYHLLKESPSVKVTILDTNEVGEGGASAVAGGFLHPLSPRGKIVFLGMKALAVTNELVERASEHVENIILRDQIYRLALDEKQSSMLQATADKLPQVSEWIGQNDLPPQLQREPDIRGALRLHSGSKVIHVPSYLKGLWSVCESLGSDRISWELDKKCVSSSFDWKQKLGAFDCVVLAAGSGLIGKLVEESELPVTLVRGQAVELVAKDIQLDHAMLGGKYVSPLPDRNRILIGATHEFQSKSWDQEKVIEELKARSYSFTSSIWENGSVDRVSNGVRVQSNRSGAGRVPIIGRFNSTSVHSNTWIFTGLSSRGLLYHGVFGKMLSSWILSGEHEPPECPVDLAWWKKEKSTSQQK